LDFRRLKQRGFSVEIETLLLFIFGSIVIGNYKEKASWENKR